MWVRRYSNPQLLVQKYKYCRSHYHKSTKTDAFGGAQACKVHIQTRANANSPASQDEDAQGGASGKRSSTTTSTLSSDLLLVTLPLGVLKSGPVLHQASVPAAVQYSASVPPAASLLIP